ncbi:MAG: DNA-deoxyinosine glycosylase [Proteobacteria bacterium]|nr:DNA-deoxyinosine glycosylase [Pseudomonadota bacterium]
MKKNKPKNPLRPETGFPPVADANSRLLILGSMPGIMSLERRQYYAQPRNAFWPIMGELYGAAAGLEYAERLQGLLDAGVALWDVLRSCERSGSLDTNIDMKTAVTNDFVAFLSTHSRIDHVFFNGSTAARVFERRVSPDLDEAGIGPLKLIRLPSTSPAHAAMPYREKLRRWSVISAP